MDNKNEMIETNQSLDTLIANSIDLIQYARQLVAKQVNLVQLMTYYSLGKWIVEVQQEGQERAQYGKKVIKALSDHLTEKFGRGFSKANLEFFRRFYLNYEDRIAETVFRQFAIEKTETVFRQLEENPPIGILMCREANDALVEITLPKDANIYASQYKLYLPDKKLLQDKLRQWIAEEES